VSSVLITAAELAEALRTEAPTLLDVRWSLGDPHGRKHYLDGHIPGAHYVDLDTELSAAPSAQEGRHPLPAIGDLQRAARSWGVCQGHPVVCYDATGNLAAARAWWLLRWGGHDNVRLLDGGLHGWTEAGHPLVHGEQCAPEEGDVELTPGNLPILSADEAADLAPHATLLDARAPERYRGDSEPIDPRAGHIPGALNAPTSENLTESGRFRSPEQLAERFRAFGATEGAQVGVYCGSGVTAAHEIAALAIAGVDAALYPGSWSAWSADASRPAATGTG
jgi:thiosulfate/3-mercaptopyruvate sulfurtransferase